MASVAITAAGRSPEGSMTRSIDSPGSSGSSPWTLTMISTPSNCRATSATRSVPLAAWGSVISTFPPKERTASKISA